MSVLLIEPHYLGSLEYFCLLAQHKQVILETELPFEKQTYLNRTYFLTANKVQQLTVPVARKSGMKLKDAKIDYSHRWVKDHWGAFYSGYGKAPFFEHFEEELHDVWNKKPEYLVDLNVSFLKSILRMAQLRVDFHPAEELDAKEVLDFRQQINPKKPLASRKIYQPIAYTQLFGNTFVPNLSIVDLIMCEGPNTAQILTESYQKY